MENTVRVLTLLSVRDQRGSRWIGARRTSGGDVVIEGQDVGVFVEDAFGQGASEYEWSYTLKASDESKICIALGGVDDEDVLQLLEEQFLGEKAAGLVTVLKKKGVPGNFWSRVGD